ncbi:MAG: hypothetical protein ACE14L_07690 [Terriglobales bacterium]
MYRIRSAYLQLATIKPDCDIHMEISQTADVNAPRMIVETPVDKPYCSARDQLRQQLAARGFSLGPLSGQLPQPFRVEVTGLAFLDYEHDRGLPQVATAWELHPAIVRIIE